MTNFLSSDLSYGDSLWGSRRINKALAGLYNEWILIVLTIMIELIFTSWFDPYEEVLPEQLITGVGCSAGRSSMFFAEARLSILLHQCSTSYFIR
jgi:1-aminocyclopropane-1-carboxylate synthase